MRDERLKRVVAYALTRVEAYLIVILVFAAVVVAVVGGWPFWVSALSVVAGCVLLMLLVVDSLSDPEMDRKTSIQDIDLDRIAEGPIRANVRRAVDYVRAAQKLAEKDSMGLSEAADEELPQLEQAARSIYQVSLRLQDFRSDGLIQRDLVELRQRRSQAGRLSVDQEAQLAALERLDDLARGAQQGIENTLAHLGRAYAEMRTIEATPEIKGHHADALDQLKDSTRHLSDLAASYDAVFADRSSGAMRGQGVNQQR